MSLWTKDGKLVVNGSGALVECGDCPCEPTTECCCGNLPDNAICDVVSRKELFNLAHHNCGFGFGSMPSDPQISVSFSGPNPCLLTVMVQDWRHGNFFDEHYEYELKEGDTCCNLGVLSLTDTWGSGNTITVEILC